jgi:hypothetical protein
MLLPGLVLLLRLRVLVLVPPSFRVRASAHLH